MELLNLYLETRKAGTRKIPPEVLTDESPLLRNEKVKVKRVLKETIAADVRNALLRAKLAFRGVRRSKLRTHSLIVKTQEELPS